jgi:predicted DNA-binding protein (UPF0251 family)
MKGTPLRSTPVRPLHPVEPGDAIAHVAEQMPELAERERHALALVDLVGRSRTAAALELGVDRVVLATSLAAARKQLRRTLEQLPAGGWCQRAELLISDRVDGVLTPHGTARLDAHLIGCERCEAHEQRLAQARGLLLEGLLTRTPASAAVIRLPELSVVDGRTTGDGFRWAIVVLAAALLVIVAAVVVAVLAATGAL